MTVVRNAFVIRRENYNRLIICCNPDCNSDPEKQIDRYWSYDMAKKAGWTVKVGDHWVCPKCSKKEGKK